MKNLVLALVAALTVLPSAVLAQSPVHWAGKAVIESATPQCGNSGAEVGRDYDASIMPKQAQVAPGPWSDVGSFIRIASDFEELSYTIYNNDLATNLTQQQIGLTRILRAGAALTFGVTMNRIIVSPAVIDANTPTVTVVTTLAQFFGIPDCTVSLRIKGVKVPEFQQNSRAGVRASPFKARTQ